MPELTANKHQLSGYLFTLVSKHRNSSDQKINCKWTRAQLAINLIEQGADLTRYHWLSTKSALYYAIEQNDPLMYSILMSTKGYQKAKNTRYGGNQSPSDIITSLYTRALGNDDHTYDRLFEVYQSDKPSLSEMKKTVDAHLEEKLEKQKAPPANTSVNSPNQTKLAQIGEAAMSGMTLYTRLFCVKSTYMNRLNRLLQRSTNPKYSEELTEKMMLLAQTPRQAAEQLKRIYEATDLRSLHTKLNSSDAQQDRGGYLSTHSGRRLALLYASNTTQFDLEPPLPPVSREALNGKNTQGDAPPNYDETVVSLYQRAGIGITR